MLVALDHRREVIPGELTDLAGERRRAVREQDLHFREATRVHQHLARRRMARVVLEIDAQPLLSHWDPGRFATPAAVHELASEGQERADRGAGLWRASVLE